AMALTDRGTALLEAHEQAAALADFALAEKVANRILKASPEDPDARFQMACIFNRRGELFVGESPSLAKAEESYDRAASLLEKLIDTHKLIPHYREEMAVTLAGRAAVRARSGASRLAEAQRDCDAARTLLTGLIDGQRKKGIRLNPQYLSTLAQ